MSAHVQQSSVLSGRSLVLVASLAVPMLFLYGLARNIGISDILPDTVMKFRFIDPEPTPVVKTVEQFRPESAVGNERTKLVVNRPEISFPIDDPVASQAGESPPLAGGGGGGVVVAPPIPSTPLGYRATRPSDDYYPPAAIRMVEQGSAQIRVCVSAAGSLQGMPTVLASSGYKRLDVAAVTWASEALRFEPATENGVAVASCKGFRVNFRLR